MFHLRFEGRSYEINSRELDLGMRSSDGAVKNAVADWLGVNPQRLHDYVVDRRPQGQIVVRPEAIYG